MIQLKLYQKRTIKELEEYLILASEKGSKVAFLILSPLLKDRPTYNDQGLIGIPFICIKIPTGGGKTIVACHTLHSIFTKYLQAKNERGLVPWLVPTDTIRTQTLIALTKREYFNREVLD